MPIGPKGPPQKPGLSIRGRVIFDTVRGVPRVRPWPPKKPTTPGTKRHLTAKAFGAANRACKVTASVFYGEHWAATRGTPLLPRDLMIAMMYGRAFALTLDDGRIIRSMASRNDVSKSLDMIGHTPGRVLVRGEKYWEATEPPTPEGWRVQLDHTISTAVASVIIPVEPDTSNMRIMGIAVTSQTADYRCLDVSTDGGLTYWSGPSDYLWTNNDGTLSTAPDLVVANAHIATARTFIADILSPATVGAYKELRPINRPGLPHFLAASTARITHIRLRNRAGALLTGGRIIVRRN